MKLPKMSVLLFVSLLCVICGLVLLMYKDVPQYVLDQVLLLRVGSFRYEAWKSVTGEVDYYLFNWTNPQEIHDVSSKPKFEEVGPYQFLEEKEKTDITWNNNSTVTYRQVRFWKIYGEDVDERLDVKVVVPNPTTLSVAHKWTSWSYTSRRALSFYLSTLKSALYMVRTPKELFFDGYKNPSISLESSLFSKESKPPEDYFGWLYQRNASVTFDGTYNIGTKLISKTGTYAKLGQLYSWNYRSNTPSYGSYCSDINGSAGELFEPPLNKSEIQLFLSEICRTVTLRYSKEVEVDGISGYKYTIDDLALDNGTINSENKCYCNGECVPSGVFNITRCRHGCPIFISLPHFYKADPFYLNSVGGLKPKKEKHEWYIIIEPVTGTVLESATRFQVNLLLRPLVDVTLFEDIPELFIPVLWYDQKHSLSREQSYSMKLILMTPAFCFSAGIAVLSIGFAMLSFVIYEICKRARKDRDNIHQDQIVPLRPIIPT